MIKIVVKHPGEPARSSSVKNTLTDLQELVGGHIEQVFAGRDSQYRIAIVFREDIRELVDDPDRRGPPTPNIRLEDGQGVIGTVAVIKYDATGELVDLNGEELEAWREWLDSAAHAPQGAEPSPASEVNDSMQVMVVPPLVDSETSEEVPPTEIIRRLMEQFERRWEDLPPAEHPTIYHSALLAMHKQDHVFTVIDESNYLLGFPDADGDRKYLRVIRFLDTEPITISNVEEFAALYAVGFEDLKSKISETVIGNFDLKVSEDGIEINGLPLEFPFTDRDWRSLLEEFESAAKGIRERTSESAE